MEGLESENYQQSSKLTSSTKDDKKKVCAFVFWKLIKIYDWKKSLKPTLGRYVVSIHLCV